MTLPAANQVLSSPAFVVSLKRHRAERYYPTKRRLNKAGFSNVYPFEGIDGVSACSATDEWSQGLVTISEYLFDMPAKKGFYTGGGQFGVFSSMLTLWTYLAMSCEEGMFIFEDDALPRPDFKDIFSEYWDSLKDPVDMIFLGGGSYPQGFREHFLKSGPYEADVSIDSRHWRGPLDCLHAYYLTRSGAQKLLKIYDALINYDKEDPLLKDHLSQNMDWFQLSEEKVKPFIDSNQHSDVFRNLQTWRPEVRSELGLEVGEDDDALAIPSNIKKLQDCFQPGKSIFNNSLQPKLQKEHYIADGFTRSLTLSNKDHWTTLRKFMEKNCSDFNHVAFIGDAIPMKGTYDKDEIPWGSLAGQSPRDCGIIHQNAYQQSSIHTTDLTSPEGFNAPSASHVFLIGPDRCGGETLLQFLGTCLPIKGDRRGRMATRMTLNYFSSMNILEGLEDDPLIPCVYGNMQAMFDAGDLRLEGNEQRAIPLAPYKFFKELYYQYPDAKFIFNTRPVNQWINGRRKIAEGFIVDYYQRCLNPDLVGTPEWHEKTPNEVVLYWKRSFENHTKDVLSFFEGKDPHRFLHFDISTDQPDRIIDFFPELDLDINDAFEIRPSWGTDILVEEKV